MNRLFWNSKARPQTWGRALPVFLFAIACYGALSRAAVAAPVPPDSATTPAPGVLAPLPITPTTQPAGAGRGGPVTNLTGAKPKRNLMKERTVRLQLRLAGYTDPALVSAVIAFVQRREAARAPLQKLADELAEALATPQYNEKKLSDLYDKFQAQLDEERERTEKAEKELDTQIHWSVNMHLTATLSLVGIVGDAALYLDSPETSESAETPSTETDATGDANAPK